MKKIIFSLALTLTISAFFSAQAAEKTINVQIEIPHVGEAAKSSKITLKTEDSATLATLVSEIKNKVGREMRKYARSEGETLVIDKIQDLNTRTNLLYPTLQSKKVALVLPYPKPNIKVVMKPSNSQF